MNQVLEATINLLLAAHQTPLGPGRLQADEAGMGPPLRAPYRDRGGLADALLVHQQPFPRTHIVASRLDHCHVVESSPKETLRLSFILAQANWCPLCSPRLTPHQLCMLPTAGLRIGLSLRNILELDLCSG